MRSNLNNGVDIQGMGNTIELKEVMNLYSSSFTEGFLKVLENYNTPLREYEKVKIEVKPKKVRKPKSEPIGNDFDKLKNPLLKQNLQKSKKVEFNPETHLRIKNLGYTSIYEMDKGSMKKWEQYFKDGKVYLDKGVNSSRISQRILFDKSIKDYFTKGDISK